MLPQRGGMKYEGSSDHDSGGFRCRIAGFRDGAAHRFTTPAWPADQSCPNAASWPARGPARRRGPLRLLRDDERDDADDADDAPARKPARSDAEDGYDAIPGFAAARVNSRRCCRASAAQGQAPELRRFGLGRIDPGKVEGDIFASFRECRQRACYSCGSFRRD